MFRVQEEFERDYMKNVDKDGYEAKMKDPNLTANEKKKEKAIYEAMEIKARRRSLGESSFNLVRDIYSGHCHLSLGGGLENKILNREEWGKRKRGKKKKGKKRGDSSKLEGKCPNFVSLINKDRYDCR